MRIDQTAPSPLTSLLADSSTSAAAALDCVVCGDRASGNHYGAKCCEGCKGFFKRWLHSQNNYICRQGTDKCVIDVETRNRCQSCRLKKCMALGMNAQTARSVDFGTLATPPQPTPLQHILLDPKMEDDEDFAMPLIDLKPFELDVERSRIELTNSQFRWQQIDELWRREMDEFAEKKKEFEILEARYMERRDVYLEAMENRKRKLDNAKEDLAIKVRRLNEAKEGNFNGDYY